MTCRSIRPNGLQRDELRIKVTTSAGDLHVTAIKTCSPLFAVRSYVRVSDDHVFVPYFSVTHIPTGLRVVDGCESLAAAKLITGAIAGIPLPWESAVADEIGFASRRLPAEVKQWLVLVNKKHPEAAL